MEKAGVLAQICSFLCPVIGVIIYFYQKNKVCDPNNYLYCAAGGFIFNLCLTI